jgi:8-oxo-dGTP pyrophosphatase MutT (NUDIX family)
MKPNKVRPIAICVIERDQKLLVNEGYDAVKRQHFCRPLGGRIEFGEQSADTIIRELREELGAELTRLQYLATFENIFTYNGQQCHEIVLVHRGELANPERFAEAVFEGVEDDGTPIRVAWVPLVDFRAGKMPLYPTGLLELL